MKNTLLLLLLITPSLFLAQTKTNLDFKTISGFVSFNDKNLPNVNVFIGNSIKYAVTDSIGFYSIQAKKGDYLNFNYVGLEDVIILVEDVTNTLNVTMKSESGITFMRSKDDLKLGGTTIGDYFLGNLNKAIPGKDLNQNATSLSTALEELIPSITVRINDLGEEIIYLKGKELNGPPIWVFDSVLYDLPIPVFVSEVKDVTLFHSKENVLIIQVNTTIDYRKVKDIDFNSYYFIEDDFYNFDATAFKKLKIGSPDFLKKYKNRMDSEEALNLYNTSYSDDKDFTNYHITILNYFLDKEYAKNNILKVLADFEEFSSNNPEDLKVIAYKYQEINEHEKAASIYKKILKLRPNYRQSYRDLANLYLELKDYPEAWKAYQYYFQKEFVIENNDIGEVILSEMMATEKNIDPENYAKKITIDSPNKTTESDVRIVFEWNTSEAEFILEFVNPTLKTFTIENSAHENNFLMIDQKEKGYTVKEIFIDDLHFGNWFVNLTYLGNKHYKPTVFKVTTYYNWGRENQRKEINVFDFILKDKKAQLLRFNRKSL